MMDRYSTLDRSISIEKRRGGWIDIRHSIDRYRSHARRGVTEIHARDKDEMTFCCWLVGWFQISHIEFFSVSIFYVSCHPRMKFTTLPLHRYISVCMYVSIYILLLSLRCIYIAYPFCQDIRAAEKR